MNTNIILLDTFYFISKEISFIRCFYLNVWKVIKIHKILMFKNCLTFMNYEMQMWGEGMRIKLYFNYVVSTNVIHHKIKTWLDVKILFIYFEENVSIQAQIWIVEIDVCLYNSNTDRTSLDPYKNNNRITVEIINLESIKGQFVINIRNQHRKLIFYFVMHLSTRFFLTVSLSNPLFNIYIIFISTELRWTSVSNKFWIHKHSNLCFV